MDIDLARTFLEIVRSGSFVRASERLHLTQTAITARIQSLEGRLGCQLFTRGRNGARLTDDGKVFVSYATQLVQTWESAQRELPLPQSHQQVLHLGSEASLCNPLLLNWVGVLRKHAPAQAVRTEVGDARHLTERLEMGVLNAALVYRPLYGPGMQVEQLLEETLIQVRVAKAPEPYVFIDWGEDFRQRHDAALPDLTHAPVSFNLGPLALQYILANGGAGYFRSRVVQTYLARGILERVPQAPEFSYPIYLVYPRERDTEALQQAFELLREVATAESDWSQRWDPLV